MRDHRLVKSFNKFVDAFEDFNLRVQDMATALDRAGMDVEDFCLDVQEALRSFNEDGSRR